MKKQDPAHFGSPEQTSSDRDVGKVDSALKPPVLSVEDEKVLTALYLRQHRSLLSYLRKTLGAGPPPPEDVAQAAFAKLAERGNLQRIRNLPAFLWRTAQNIVMSDYRAAAVRRAREPDVVDVFIGTATDALDAERVLMARDELGIVVTTLKAMPAHRRQVLLMSRLDGLSNAEIARRMGLARSTVSEHLARAMLQLDAVMNEAAEEL
jgi:RNA polymerase sigma-70 factor (ECF subfamily)